PPPLGTRPRRVGPATGGAPRLPPGFPVLSSAENRTVVSTEKARRASLASRNAEVCTMVPPPLRGQPPVDGPAGGWLGTGPQRTPISGSGRSGSVSRHQGSERDNRPDDEDRRREVDKPKMAEGVEVVRVMRGQGHREPEHGCGHRGHVGPDLSASYTEPGETGRRQSGRGDEPGHRDVQVRDVVEEVGVERLDLVAA